MSATDINPPLGTTSRVEPPAGSGRRGRQKKPPRRPGGGSPLLYLLPTVALLLGIFLLPLYDLIRLSLTDSSLFRSEANFVGLGNYRSLVTAEFGESLWRTAVWVGVTVPAATVLGVSIALLLNSALLPWKPLFRILIILPWLMPEALIAVMWSWLLHPHYGILNATLKAMGVIEEGISFFTIDGAFPTVLLIRIWRGLPFMVLIALAALQTVPKELEEAAQLDGASYLNRVRYLIVPHIAKMVIGGAVLLTAWSLVIFDLVFVLTGGGPARTTEIVSITIYKQAFQQFDLGLAAASATIVLVVTALVGALHFRSEGKERS